MALEGAVLEGPEAARFTVITPNRRLAAALRDDFDRRQAARGLSAWPAADILPVSAFIERLYEDALYSQLADGVPQLLSSAQEHAVWETIIERSPEANGLLSVPRAAEMASEAWALAHEWRIATRWGPAMVGEDARAFAAWAARYESGTRRNAQIDRARLPDWLAARLEHPALAKPATLIAYGFDIRTPRIEAFLQAMEKAGTRVRACAPERRDARVQRVAFDSAEQELRAAAGWARERLEAEPNSSIGIVVPRLEGLRHAVRRIFHEAMDPARLLTENPAPAPFNISLGDPLADAPVAAAALLLIGLAAGPVAYDSASRVLRSPFVAGAQAESAERARLDAALRRIAGDSIGLEALRRLLERLAQSDAPRRAPPCPKLAQSLDAMASISRRLGGLHTSAHWARLIDELLRASGFPGDRVLDSHEFQSLAKWHELIARFAALERVLARMSFADAATRLERMTSQTLFQPQSDSVPVQIMGVLESLGLRFDQLWVCGLTEEAWPLAPRPHPFIPLALQRDAGVPQASAARSLALDRHITEGWCGAAKEVILSHALREEDRELAASPLIAHLPRIEPEALMPGDRETLLLRIWGARRMEWLERDAAPAVAANFEAAAVGDAIAVSGGTALFRDQAVCPFRAFALHRLGAESLEHPGPGLDARDRGTLLHAMLAELWTQLRSKARLEAAPERDLLTLLGQAADTAINRLRRQRPEALRGRLAALERTRLIRLGRQWLALERQRPDFEVAAIEEKHSVESGGIRVNARLDRMDRIDGRHVVIDYKGGRAAIADWLGERPDEPQLPLYVVARGGRSDSPGEVPAVAGVAFARVRVGEMAFRGLAAEEGWIPGVGTPAKQRGAEPSWQAQVARWRTRLEHLGREFAAGDARIAPKHGEETCRRCELRPLCRIEERTNTSFEDGADE